MTDPADRIPRLVDHLFRREAGRMVAVLTRSFGPAHLGLAEEVVQDALVRALRHWPFHGVPDNPRAWLYTVARHLALDRLRREAMLRDKESEIRRLLEESSAPETGEPSLEGELTDDQLRLIFLCCHPRLSRDARVALTLKTVVGFGVREIARPFLAKPSTVAQRLVRAQRRIRELELPYEVPGRAELPARLDTVLEVLYLMFNEGYGTHEGDELVRSDVCAEAVRLAEQLAALPSTARPAVHALAALLCFQASRIPARVDAQGNLVLLRDQDRGLWDHALIRRAFGHLERASRGDEQTAYHVQAAIAAHHASARDDATTDWRGILALYDRLVAINPSPIVSLNRAVAVARIRGAEAGLGALADVVDDPAVRGYYLLHATVAELQQEAGRPEEAAAAYRRALDCPCSEPERRFLRAKLERTGRPRSAGSEVPGRGTTLHPSKAVDTDGP